MTSPPIFGYKILEFTELENQGSFKKEKLLINIRHIYLRTKRAYISKDNSEMATIRKHADDIFEDIENELEQLIERSNQQGETDIYFAIPLIIVDAFMRCKIMEPPRT